MNAEYVRTVHLLLAVEPAVFDTAAFAMKGGTALNLFLQDMPRLSVDNKAGDDPDLPVVSETSDNFISKLRISVTPISATPGESARGFKAFDVAFLHDVVSRAAQSEWLSVPWTNDRPNLEHAPSRWSYRSVSGESERKSTTFLSCPWQTASGWAYVSAVAAVCRQLDALPGERYLPALRISLQNPALAGMIKDAHDLAEWVATYDELLDKRQLQHNDITVVRKRLGVAR